MKHLWEVINYDLKHHVQILKALEIMEFLAINGQERILQDLKDDILKIRTLQESSYYQDGLDR